MKDFRTIFIRSRKLRAVYTCVYGKVPLLLLACLPNISFFFKQVLPIVSSFLFHYTNEPFLWCTLLRLITLASENRNSRRGVFANNCVKSVKFHSIFAHTNKEGVLDSTYLFSLAVSFEILYQRMTEPLLYKSLPHPPCPWKGGEVVEASPNKGQRVIFEATKHPYS